MCKKSKVVGFWTWRRDVINERLWERSYVADCCDQSLPQRLHQENMKWLLCHKPTKQWLNYTFWGPETLKMWGLCFLWAQCYTTALYGITFDTDCFSQSTLKWAKVTNCGICALQTVWKLQYSCKKQIARWYSLHVVRVWGPRYVRSGLILLV